MNYYSALKRKEVQAHTTTCMNLEDVMRKISQSRKDNYYVITLI